MNNNYKLFSEEDYTDNVELFNGEEEMTMNEQNKIILYQGYSLQSGLVHKRNILIGNGNISHQQAIEKAEKEFEIYRKREMQMLESDFDKILKSLKEKLLKKLRTSKSQNLKTLEIFLSF